jgi:tetratricopeptide (TPR) repeat protein
MEEALMSGQRGNLLTEAQIEQITRIVARVLQSQQEASKGLLSRSLDWVTSKGATLPIIIGAILIIIGLWLTDTSPMQLATLSVTKYREVELQARTVERHIATGDSFLDNNRPTAAKVQFEQALELDPRNPEAQFGLDKANLFIPITEKYYDPSLAHQKLSQFLKERKVDKNCTDNASEGSADPGNTHIYAYLGDLAQDLADSNPKKRTSLENALKCYERAIALDGNNSYAYFGQGSVYVRQS